jgi:hypothetical protein
MQHWAIRADGLLTWTGDSVDPPAPKSADQTPFPPPAIPNQERAVTLEALLQGRLSQTERTEDMAPFLRIHVGELTPSDIEGMPTFIHTSGDPGTVVYVFRSGCILSASSLQHEFVPGTILDAVVRPTLAPLYQFYPHTSPPAVPLLSRHSQETSKRARVHRKHRSETRRANRFGSMLPEASLLAHASSVSISATRLPSALRSVSSIEIFPPTTADVYQRTWGAPTSPAVVC